MWPDPGQVHLMTLRRASPGGAPRHSSSQGAQIRAALVLCLVGLPAEIYVSESPSAVRV